MTTKERGDVKNFIRERLKALDLTMKDASLAIGRNHAFLEQFLKGRTPKKLSDTDRIKLAPVLGVQPERLRSDDLLTADTYYAAPVGPAGRVPIYGLAEAGLVDEDELWSDTVVKLVLRPPPLEGSVDGYGLFVRGQSMEPRYFQGEIVFLDPGMPVRDGDFVVIRMKPKNANDAIKRAFIKRLKTLTPLEITVEQYNPPRMRKIVRKEIEVIHKIVGTG